MKTFATLALIFVAGSQAFTPSGSVGVARHSSLNMMAEKKAGFALPTFGKKAAAPKASIKNDLAALKKAQYAEDPTVVPGMGLTGTTEKSVALPFTAYPSTLDGSMVGDVGFDPLGLAKTPQPLDQYRLAELKHSRLAMLAAVGFIVSEEEDFKFASQLGLPSMLTDTDGRALDVALEVNPLFYLVTLIAGGFTELQAKNYASSIIGDVGFDPLKLYPENEVAQQRMRLAELKHGRIAMLAVLVFALDEEFLKVPVIDLIKDRTGGLFPIPEEDVAGYNKFEGLVSLANDVAQQFA